MRDVERPISGPTLGRMALLAFLSFSVGACASHAGPAGSGDSNLAVYPPTGMVHRVGSPAIELFWNCSRPGSDRVRVDGWAFNRWFAGEVQDLRFELVGVDGAGKTVSGVLASAAPASVGIMRSVSFELEVQTRGSEARFDLYYEYRFQESGDDTFDSSRILDSPPTLSGILVAS